MKTNLRCIYFIIFLFIVFSACEKKHEVDSSGEPTTEDLKELKKQQLYIGLIRALTRKDSLGVGEKYEIYLGDVLDEANPKVRSIGVTSFREAFKIIKNGILSGVPDESYTTLADSSVFIDIGHYGKFSFKRTNSVRAAEGDINAYAVIDINLKNLSIVRKINFIDTLHFDNNGAGAEINVGETWKYEKDNKEYFCILPAKYGQTGVLIHIRKYDYNKHHLYYFSTYHTTSFLYRDFPEANEWNAIHDAYRRNCKFKEYWNYLGLPTTDASIFHEGLHPIGSAYQSDSWLWWARDTYFLSISLYHFNEPYISYRTWRTNETSYNDLRYWGRANSFYPIIFDIHRYKQDDNMSGWTKVRIP